MAELRTVFVNSHGAPASNPSQHVLRVGLRVNLGQPLFDPPIWPDDESDSLRVRRRGASCRAVGNAHRAIHIA